MRNHGVWQDSDTERADPNLPDTFEAKRRSQEAMEEQDDEIYGDPEKSILYRSLDPTDPGRARRRVGTLYWRAWKRVTMAFFLTSFGVTFCLIGVGCMLKCDEADRGVGFLICGLLMLLPGVYGSIILVAYLRGLKGYHYRELPEME